MPTPTVMDADERAAEPLPGVHDARWLHDEGLAAREAPAVFHPSWQLAADRASLADAGSYLVAEVAGEPVLLARAEDGVLRAFANVCRHRGSPVARGEGRASELQCPYHGWRYRLDGRCRSRRDLVSLPRLGVTEIGPLVFVRVAGDTDRAPFGDLARVAAGHRDLRRALELRYDVRANWKLVVENFNECYHCRLVHPTTLAPKIDLRAYRVEPRGDHAVHHIRSAPVQDLRPGGPDAAPTDDRHTYWLWPNAGVSLLPRQLVTFVVRPAGSERCTVERGIYGVEGPEAQSLAEYLDAVMREDVAVVEALQGNVRSRFWPEPALVGRREAGVADFRELLDEAYRAAS